MINKILGFILMFFIYLLSARATYAVTYDLIAPSGTLTRGQEVQFTINVDTEGQTITDAAIGMTHKSDVLQYISTTPGDAFPTISTDSSTAGQLIFTASNSSGFSGSGVFATVTYKLIATAPGSTELCVLFNPSSTPTPGPLPTSPPTALPKTGSTGETGKGAVLGTFFVLLSGAALILIRSLH